MLRASTEIKPTLFERVLGFFSPEAAYKRMAFRSAFDAGRPHRSRADWSPVGGNSEMINGMSRQIIREKARDLERNSDITNSVIGAFERNVVGNGFKLQADTGDDKLNMLIETAFETWQKPSNCDITGTQSFVELCTMAVRRMRVDGGMLFLKTYTGSKQYPLQLQARDISDLDGCYVLPQNVKKGHALVNGVELNPYGKPVAYYIRQQKIDGWYDIEPVRMPADMVIPLWMKYTPQQVREMSPLAMTVGRVANTEDYLSTIAIKEKTLACLAIFIKRQNPVTGSMPGRFNMNAVDERTGYQQRSLTPGMIEELLPGDEAQSVIPSGQASNAKDMLCTFNRFIGAGQGLSYEAVSRDMSQVNYSSARQGLLEDRRTYQRMQRFLIDHFLDVVYEAFLDAVVTAGTIHISDYWQNRDKYLAHYWTAPGWSWIDPVKEVTANTISINSNQESLASVCSKNGVDWEATLEQRAKELKRQKELEAEYGISFKEGGNTFAEGQAKENPAES